MARATISTTIPLDRAARILGLDPLHFNSVVSDNRPARYDCDDVWLQYEWQAAGRVSRESLADALRQAEDEVFTYLGYYLTPTWVFMEPHRLPKDARIENWSPYQSQGFPKSIRSDKGYVLAGGVRATSTIEVGAAVVFSDEDGDDYNETATVTVATTVENDYEIRVYFPDTGPLDEWEIRPINVNLDTDADQAVITFRRELIPDPDLWEKQYAPDDPTSTINGDDDDNFLLTVDVYRVYNDPSNHGYIVSPGSCATCSDGTCARCAATNLTVCLHVRDTRLGILAYKYAVWDEDTEQYTYPTLYPGGSEDQIFINYYTGKVDRRQQNPYRDVTPRWERMIVHYALTMLTGEPVGCDNFKEIYNYQVRDLAEIRKDSRYVLNFDTLKNPFGTSRAGIRLWQAVERERLVVAR